MSADLKAGLNSYLESCYRYDKAATEMMYTTLSAKVCSRFMLSGSVVEGALLTPLFGSIRNKRYDIDFMEILGE